MGIQIMGALATIVGVILGFALGQGAEHFKLKRDKKKTVRSVRLLLFLETKKNYRLLSIYWRGLDKLVTEQQGGKPANPSSSHAHAIVDVAFPVFSRLAWDNVFVRMPESFSYEEIIHIWDYYEDLLQLAKLRMDILDLRRDCESKIVAAETAPLIGKVIPDGEFLEKAKGPVDDFIRIIKGIMEYGGMERIFSVEDKQPLFD
jgi:hypothetical protein